MCAYDALAKKLPEYMQGYVEGIIEAQVQVHGYNFIADSITDEWAEQFRKYTGYEIMPDYIDDPRMLIADQFIGYKCTQKDRIKTLNAICERFKMDLYTTEDKNLVPKANFRGIADSRTMMPKIFQCSKIKLNMTAKTIRTGLAQRIFDVMAVGGFLISNYQAEIPEYFVPGEDIVLYESIPDLLDKIAYYLSHEEERLLIARNGQEKVRKFHSYKTKLEQLLQSTRIWYENGTCIFGSAIIRKGHESVLFLLLYTAALWRGALPAVQSKELQMKQFFLIYRDLVSRSSTGSAILS